MEHALFCFVLVFAVEKNMSSLQVSRRNLIGQGKDPPAVGVISQKRRARPQRTKISEIFPDTNAAKDATSLETPMHSSRLTPLDKTVMSLELLNQYNDIIGADDSLSFKRLPPVKLSYQPTKKFMESPRADVSSRIIRPHLTMKTYSPGHHIFTEGISKNSEIASPTFALNKVGVPYSNLPDSIAVYKEKDKFAFGVTKREEYDKSPYRLTPKPLVFGHGQLITDIHNKIVIPTTDADADSLESPTKSPDKLRTGRTPAYIKSNVVKLEPLPDRDNREGSSGEMTLCRSSTFAGTDKKNSLKTNESWETKHGRERKLSVISIGDSVEADFFSKGHRETRQLYPMYDHLSKKQEQFRKETFGHLGRFHAKPHVPTSTFTYKVSTTGRSFVQDPSPDKFRPIRNNLRDRHGYTIKRQRGRTRYKDDSDSSSKDDKRSSDYNFRRFYSRSYHLPNSAGSGSTNMTLIPGNPPPSEISHILSEEGAPVTVNDLRSGMLTLHEERTTLTESHLSHRGAEEGTGNDKHQRISRAESNVGPLEDGLTSRTNVTYDTDTERQFETAEKMTLENKDRIYHVNSPTKSSVDKYVAEAEARIKEDTDQESQMNENTDKEDPESANVNGDKKENSGGETSEALETKVEDTATGHETNGKKDVPTETKDGSNEEKTALEQNIDHNGKIVTYNSKQCLSVPTLSLDNTAELPCQKERTSLSRKIQNMSLPETRYVPPAANFNEHDTIKPTGRDQFAPVPVTELRLFSEVDSGLISSATASITEEIGEHQEVLSRDDPDRMKVEMVISADKRLVNNSNVQFIYPSTSEIKAKRQ